LSKQNTRSAFESLWFKRRRDAARFSVRTGGTEHTQSVPIHDVRFCTMLYYICVYQFHPPNLLSISYF